MIPREIFKKIQPIELRTNRIVTGLAARGCETDGLDGFCHETRQIALKQPVVKPGRRIENQGSAFQNRGKGQKIGARPEKVGAATGQTGAGVLKTGATIFQTGAALPETGAGGFKSGAVALINGGWGFESGAVIVKVVATPDRNAIARIHNREIRQIRENGKSGSSFYVCSRGLRGSRLKIAFP